MSRVSEAAAAARERAVTPTWAGPLAALSVELPAGAAQNVGRWWAVQLTTGLLVAGRACGTAPSYDLGLQVRIAAQLPASHGRVSLQKRARWESEARHVARALGVDGWDCKSEVDKAGVNTVTVALVWTEVPTSPQATGGVR